MLDDDHRWAVARNLLQSDTVAVVDRVAGLLVLLYGQSTSRIVRLTVHDVIDTSVLVQLRLGAEPVALPSPSMTYCDNSSFGGVGKLRSVTRTLTTGYSPEAIRVSHCIRWLYHAGSEMRACRFATAATPR